MWPSATGSCVWLRRNCLHSFRLCRQMAVQSACPVDSVSPATAAAATAAVGGDPPAAAASSSSCSSLPVHRLPVPLRQWNTRPRLAWVENFDSTQRQRVALAELHPTVFAAQPRLHLIHQNVTWQQRYRQVDYRVARTRAEMPGGGRKPWPQKGTGRARHGSIRSPLFKGGGVSHGPRGPNSDFYMLSKAARVGGLCATLSVKFAQGDLHVVDSLTTLASPSSESLRQLVTTRLWQHSVLFVDSDDLFPDNLVLAAGGVPYYRLMPVYGVNVFSLLKFDTIVLTLAGLQLLQQRIVACVEENVDEGVHKDPSFFS